MTVAYGESALSKKKTFISGTSFSKMAEKMPMTNLALDAPAHQQHEKVEAVKKIVLGNRRITIREFSEIFWA